jgi:hypothetical protein
MPDNALHWPGKHENIGRSAPLRFILAYLITVDFLEVRASFLLLSSGIAESSCDFAA